jgi:hypothetical protein
MSPKAKTMTAPEFEAVGNKFGTVGVAETRFSHKRNTGYAISVQEVVGEMTRKPAFGYDFYTPPSNEMILKKVPFGNINKTKYSTFANDIQNQKKWIPGPDHYLK